MFTATIRAAVGNVSGTSTVTIQVPLPVAPTNLVATKSSNLKVKLTWTDNASNETGFYVQTSTDGVNWTTYATLVASSGTGKTVSYTTSPLATGKRYFRVLAYNATGTTSSNTVSLTL
jgi:large repetitive protein